MAPDDRTALLEELPERAGRSAPRPALAPSSGRSPGRLLQYDEDTVGRLMTPDYVAGPEGLDRQAGPGPRPDARQGQRDAQRPLRRGRRPQLIDDIRIREILLAPLHANVRDIMDNQFVALRATDDKKSAVEVFRKYDRTALPVVDGRGVLVGIVTIDDVLDVAEEQATRELQRFGGLEALDEPYMATPLLAMVRKRATWLVILFLGEMLTATAMGFFEGEIEKAVVLALFVPLIISSGGNSGSQAATLIIRALALGEVKLRDWWMVMRREILSGLLLGGDPRDHRLPADRHLERLLRPSTARTGP